MDYVEVNIRKPIYGTYVAIRDKYIRQARLRGKLLKITIPQGSMICTPDEWMEGAETMKKVFLQPDNPMILFANYVRLNNQPKGEMVKQPHVEKGKDFFTDYELAPEHEDIQPKEPHFIQEKLPLDIM